MRFSEGRCVMQLLHGKPMYGKTSVIDWMRKNAREPMSGQPSSSYPLIVSLERLNKTTLDDLIRYIDEQIISSTTPADRLHWPVTWRQAARTIEQYVSIADIKLGKGPEDLLISAVLRARAREVASDRNGIQPDIFMFIDQINDDCRECSQAIKQLIFDLYRAYWGGEQGKNLPRLYFAIAASPGFFEMINSQDEIKQGTNRRIVQVPINRFTHDEVAAYCEGQVMAWQKSNPATGVKLTIDTDRMYALSGGHPLLINQIGNAGFRIQTGVFNLDEAATQKIVCNTGNNIAAHLQKNLIADELLAALCKIAQERSSVFLAGESLDEWSLAIRGYVGAGFDAVQCGKLMDGLAEEDLAEKVPETADRRRLVSVVVWRQVAKRYNF
jgi:hypothetical protein